MRLFRSGGLVLTFRRLLLDVRSCQVPVDQRRLPAGEVPHDALEERDGGERAALLKRVPPSSGQLTTFSSGTVRLSVHSWLLTKASAETETVYQS